MIQKLQLPIVDRKDVAEKTVEITFGLGKNDFSFKAGQYIRVTVPKLLKDDPKGDGRDFSICSSPNNKKSIATCFRDSGSGFKDTLVKSSIGTKIEVKGPLGVFTLPESVEKSIIMIAGGVGITPFMSMIRYATEDKLDYELTLIYTNKSPEKAAYLRDLQQLEKQNTNFKSISRFQRVDAEFIKENVENMNNSIFYVCGTPDMVMGVRKILMEMGVTEDNINFEEFSGY